LDYDNIPGSNDKWEETISDVVKALCEPESYGAVIHSREHGTAMPEMKSLDEAMGHLRAILFPGYFGPSEIKPETMQYYIGSFLDGVARIFAEQVRRGFCFFCETRRSDRCADCERKAGRITSVLISRLPEIRRLLATDVEAAYEGDPAASSPDEAIFSYPSLRTLVNHRIAHELYKLEVPLIPRIISEMAHGATGIDIHPGARIGEKFFMDHGTGIVIGETCVIGKNVRVYQGVTLGAKSFPFDKDGNPIKGIPRHPVVEDDVIIYSGATILGRITIGKGSVIGGNVWLLKSVPPGSRVIQGRHQESSFEEGGGI
jgi:serine O-acetyltransferase